MTNPPDRSVIHVELHCHTVFSHDGLMTFDSLLRAAEAVGLDAVAITDHDTMDGAKEFSRLARSRGSALEIIPGEEKTLADGSHFIGLFLQEPIASGDLAGAIQEIESQGGLCLIPHPFRRKDGLFRDGLERLPLFEGSVAGFELFSAKCSFAENQQARSLLGTGLSPFGGSDAHYESDLGECVNVITRSGDLKSSVLGMFGWQAPFQILGKRQEASAPERAYAPLYYRCRKYVRLPRSWVPAAKQCYRWYRNAKYGIGRKSLMEVYADP